MATEMTRGCKDHRKTRKHGEMMKEQQGRPCGDEGVLSFKRTTEHRSIPAWKGASGEMASQHRKVKTATHTEARS